MFNETSYNNLGDLGSASGKAAKGTSFIGAAASTAAPFAIAGPVGIAVGAIVGVVSGIVASIFGAHAAKVATEDEATQGWAASGPQSIESVMSAWRGGQLSSSDAIASLDSVMSQYVANMSSVSKYNGKFGVLPDPNAPRPSNSCNASCGIYWDTMQQVKNYKAEIQGGSGGLNLSSMFSGGGGIAGIPLPVLIIGALILTKVIKI
jgi:hypothetical protein